MRDKRLVTRFGGGGHNDSNKYLGGIVIKYTVNVYK